MTVYLVHYVNAYRILVVTRHWSAASAIIRRDWLLRSGFAPTVQVAEIDRVQDSLDLKVAAEGKPLL